MSGSILQPPKPQFFTDNGVPLDGGKVYTYTAGTSTPKTTYTTYDLSVANANPVILDSGGRANIWGEGAFKVVVKNKHDVTIYTVDDVRLNGTVATIVGGFSVDHTLGAQPYPVTFTHSNVFSNSDTYGSGAVIIEATSLNNNQPILIAKKNVNSSTLGNSTNLLLWNAPDSITAASDFAADIELIANNSAYSDYNGKWEIAVQSGRNTGDTNKRDGYLYIAPRRGPLNPSGQNTGFEKCFFFYPLTASGKGMIETLGNGITFTPEYDFNTSSVITMTNAFGSSIWTNQSTFAGTGSARIQNYGIDDSYIITKATTGQAAVYIRSEEATAYLQMQPSTVSGTSSAAIDMYCATDDYYKVQANGTDKSFNIRFIDSGSTKNTIDILSASDGMTVFYKHSSTEKGHIRLGNGAGAAGGGILDYDSATGVLDFSGTNNYITAGSSGLIEPTRVDVVTATDGGTATPSKHITECILDGAGALTTYTVTLPTTPINNHKLTVASDNVITTLTVNSADGTAIISGAPTTLAAGGFFQMIFITSSNKWWRVG